MRLWDTNLDKAHVTTKKTTSPRSSSLFVADTLHSHPSMSNYAASTTPAASTRVTPKKAYASINVIAYSTIKTAAKHEQN